MKNFAPQNILIIEILNYYTTYLTYIHTKLRNATEQFNNSLSHDTLKYSS